MLGSLAPPISLATATAREILRRPGVALSCVAVGALILVLHDLSASAFDRSGQLATELALSSITLYLGVVGGVTGVRVMTEGDELGPAPELSASPVSPLQYILARYAGVLVALVTMLLALLCFATVAELRYLSTPDGSPGPIPLDLVGYCLVGGVLHAAVFTAFGCALGTVAPPQLALVLLALAFVVARTVVPELSEQDGLLSAWTLLVPDPARLDLSHSAGFSKPLSTAAIGAGAAGALLQTVGLLALTRWLFGLRGR